MEISYEQLKMLTKNIHAACKNNPAIKYTTVLEITAKALGYANVNALATEHKTKDTSDDI